MAGADRGTYNAAYAVRLADGTETVLKVAPRPHLKLLSHEVDLMRTEADFYRRAGGAGVAVPEVVFAGFDRDAIGTDFAFLSRVDGVALRTVIDDLPPAPPERIGDLRRRARLAGPPARGDRRT
jgi:aminoglycoside phosphotransferase (APT) family kinase protein